MFLACMLIGQNLYLKATNNLVRYSNSTKSPLLALSLEISTGLVEIRAIKKQNYFKAKIRNLVDENIKFYPIKFCLKASYMFWGEMLNLLFIQIPSIIITIYSIRTIQGAMDKKQVKSLLYFVSDSKKIGYWINTFINNANNIENQLINVERCINYRELDSEVGYVQHEIRAVKQNETNRLFVEKEEQLITHGRLVFKDVCARYPFKRGDVITSMSFEIEPGQKIGVVGKSGAGKSSLIKLLWRFLEPYSGVIEVDGVDILSYNLKDYRREVSIVSQETCIFVGTLRENIDPKHSYFKDDKQY